VAHLLQRLIGALSPAALGIQAALALNAAPFSHKLHLKLKPECTACHASAAASAKAADNLLPPVALCRECHQQEVSIKSPSRLTVSHFNHALHARFGNLAPVIASAVNAGQYLSAPGDIRRHLNTKTACAACHRGMEESEAVSLASFPRMADCLVCHNKIDNPFSCEKCHSADVKLKPVNHTPDFLDRHTTGKMGLDKTTCAVCHGRRFSCLGCH